MPFCSHASGCTDRVIKLEFPAFARQAWARPPKAGEDDAAIETGSEAVTLTVAIEF
jgi:hypothetical protein